LDSKTTEGGLKMARFDYAKERKVRPPQKVHPYLWVVFLGGQWGERLAESITSHPKKQLILRIVLSLFGALVAVGALVACYAALLWLLQLMGFHI
jgi:hypothetical protein